MLFHTFTFKTYVDITTKVPKFDFQTCTALFFSFLVQKIVVVVCSIFTPVLSIFTSEYFKNKKAVTVAAAVPLCPAFTCEANSNFIPILKTLRHL